jgi:hypothetical protein
VNFQLSNNGPVVVNVNGTPYNFARFRRRDWVDWGAAIDAERNAAATEGLEPQERARLLMVFPPQPVTHNELAARIATPAGVERIIRACGERGGVPKDVLDQLLEDGNEIELESLAMILASVIDPLKMAAQAKGNGEKPAEDPNPLPPPSAPASSA